MGMRSERRSHVRAIKGKDGLKCEVWWCRESMRRSSDDVKMVFGVVLVCDSGKERVEHWRKGKEEYE